MLNHWMMYDQSKHKRYTDIDKLVWSSDSVEIQDLVFGTQVWSIYIGE